MPQVNERTDRKEWLSQEQLLYPRSVKWLYGEKKLKTITTTTPFFFQQLIRFYVQMVPARVQVGKSGKHFVSLYMQGKERGEKTCTKLKKNVFLKIRAASGRGGCGETCVSVKQRAPTLSAFLCRSPLINYHNSLRDCLNLGFIITPVFKEDKVASAFQTSTRATHSHTEEFHCYKSSGCSVSYCLVALVQ